MCYTFSNLAKYLNYKNNKINQIFGSRYSATRIIHQEHTENIIRYIYQNPIKAGIAKSPFDYPFSSLGFYFGYKNNGLVLKPDQYTQNLLNLGIEGLFKLKRKIEDPIKKEDHRLIQESLRRSEFKFTLKQLKEIRGRQSSLIL
ncbi:MAG: hypothetical protein ABIA04_15515 [Pseudomonadota bacterium]